jgi:hypothetical protein
MAGNSASNFSLVGSNLTMLRASESLVLGIRFNTVRIKESSEQKK